MDTADGKVIFRTACEGIVSMPVVEDEHLYFNSASSGAGVSTILGNDEYNNDVVKIPAAPPGVQSWKEIW